MCWVRIKKGNFLTSVTLTATAVIKHFPDFIAMGNLKALYTPVLIN